MVAGGFSNDLSKLESTEFLVLNSRPTWVQMAPLPAPWNTGTVGIVGVTVDNVVLLLGGEAELYVNRMVQYEDQRWVGVGQNLNMTLARSEHAVSVIDIDLVTLQQCCQ